ncbi:MAG: N-methyl-L-tryptophan oxidase [Bacteroidota bacterium]
MSSESTYDVIVIGVGSMGSAACYHLAKRGCHVLGIEQFDIAHELGSHGGQTRIIRKAYGESSDYVPLLERAYRNWHQLEQASGEQVFFKPGIVYLAPKGNDFLDTVRKSSVNHGVPIDELTVEQCASKYPQFALPDTFEVIVEPDAGFLTPERCILLMAQEALKQGATFRTNEGVIDWKRTKEGVEVRTSRGTYSAKKLIITAGPWAGKLVPALQHSLTVTRQVIAWVKPKKWGDYTMDRFPCWLLEGEKTFYGFPIVPAGLGGPLGLKFALHRPLGEDTDPKAVNRTVSEEDLSELIRFLNQFMPDAFEQVLATKTCLYTNTPDLHFVVDYLPDHGQDVAIAAGLSGHGFKFAIAIGEVLVDLVLEGGTDLPISFLNVDRIIA